RFLRRFRLARTVEGDRLANERLEGGLVNFFYFVDVDRAACVSLETRVEETGRILQRRALGEGKLHDILVGFASADDAVVRPDRSAHPLPLLDDGRVRFLDERAHSAEGSPTPVAEFGDSFRDELRCRLALARARLFHDQRCQRSRVTIWIRLPHVSLSMAMVEPVTLVGGRVKCGPSGFMRSYSRWTSSATNMASRWP